MDPFKVSPTGVLVSLEEDAFTGFLYNIWFPYTKSNMAEINVGSFVAIKNFDALIGVPQFSILELISVLPVHYALGATPRETERAFPGFVVEAAKAARLDWEQEEPIEQTTKIRASAIPVNFQLVSEGSGHNIEPDESMPMIGEEAHLLTNDTINMIINQNLMDEAVPSIAPCWLQLNKEIDVCLSTDDLLRTHFGIFGFTGSGKSNLLSTIVSNLTQVRGLKIVLIDLMLEYTGLLIDHLVQLDNAFILCIDKSSLPGGTSLQQTLRGEGNIERAIQNMTETLLLPKEISPHKNHYRECFRSLILQNKIRMYSPGSGGGITGTILYDMLSESLPADNLLGRCLNGTMEWLGHIESFGDDFMDPEVLARMLQEAREFIRDGMPETFEVEDEDLRQTTIGPRRERRRDSDIPIHRLSASARQYFRGVARILRGLIETPEEERYPPQLLVSMIDLINLMNDPTSSALILVQGNKDDDLRRFSSNFVVNLFNNRKSNGINSPQSLFIYDEADEFLPAQARDTYSLSKASITTLARRGRKFGMGVSIATQRVAYLDTSILAQMHTYLISKLTRKYDRETISNAFGLSEEMLRKTLRFTKGQWMLVSYEATGLENVPIPVQFPNANTRILDFLRGFNRES